MLGADKEREDRAKKYWHEHQLSYDGPTPEPWETMAAFAKSEITCIVGESIPPGQPLRNHDTYFIALWRYKDGEETWLPCTHAPFLSYRSANQYVHARTEEELSFQIVKVVAVLPR